MLRPIPRREDESCDLTPADPRPSLPCPETPGAWCLVPGVWCSTTSVEPDTDASADGRGGGVDGVYTMGWVGMRVGETERGGWQQRRRGDFHAVGGGERVRECFVACPSSWVVLVIVGLLCGEKGAAVDRTDPSAVVWSSARLVVWRVINVRWGHFRFRSAAGTGRTAL